MIDLTKATPENAAFMVDEIKKKLRVATGAAIKASHFDEEMYFDLKDIYDMVVGKERFSISEIEAIVSELGKLRKSEV